MIVDMKFEFPEAYIEMGEVGVDEFVQNGLLPLASNLFKAAIMEQITGKPGVKSDNDPVPVTLRVKDWMAIRDNLQMDADAEYDDPRTPQREEDWPACHATASATNRCADKIDHALMRHGWMS